jgi:galactokinase
VFPAAVDRSIWIGARRRKDNEARLYSDSFKDRVAFDTATLERTGDSAWANYPKGVICELQKLGFQAGGFEAVVWGDVPMGAGLSSSAAFEVAVAFTLARLNGFEIAALDMIKLCQRAENQFVGVNCGIMDQFIATLGKRDHALFLDCRLLDYERIPLSTETVSVVICNSGVERGLVDSEYNRRRRECEEGVRVFSRYLPNVKALRDVSMEGLETYKDRLSPDVLKRCRHVITENARVQQAVGRLKEGDVAGFGKLMDDSHQSMRDDYEISCDALDLLVDLARECRGTLGARLTGAGFGGCTVNVVENAYVADFVAGVREGYQGKMRIDPQIYVSAIDDGVGEAPTRR